MRLENSKFGHVTHSHDVMQYLDEFGIIASRADILVSRTDSGRAEEPGDAVCSLPQRDDPEDCAFREGSLGEEEVQSSIVLLLESSIVTSETPAEGACFGDMRCDDSEKKDETSCCTGLCSSDTCPAHRGFEQESQAIKPSQDIRQLKPAWNSHPVMHPVALYYDVR